MTPVDPTLVAPAWLGSVDDLEETPARILLAAAELFSDRSPSQVPLRTIAARAGVNYGLIHHYFKTKEAVLAELLRRATAVGASRIRDTETVDDALGRLFTGDADTNYARMLAWAMLDETAPERLVSSSPVIAHLTTLIGAELGEDHDVAPEIVAVVTLSAFLGWRLYRPFLTIVAGLDERDEHDVEVEVLATIHRFARRDARSGRVSLADDRPSALA